MKSNGHLSAEYGLPLKYLFSSIKTELRGSLSLLFISPHQAQAACKTIQRIQKDPPLQQSYKKSLDLMGLIFFLQRKLLLGICHISPSHTCFTGDCEDLVLVERMSSNLLASCKGDERNINSSMHDTLSASSQQILEFDYFITPIGRWANTAVELISKT